MNSFLATTRAAVQLASEHAFRSWTRERRMVLSLHRQDTLTHSSTISETVGCYAVLDPMRLTTLHNSVSASLTLHASGC